MSVEVTIYCDICSVIGGAQKSAREARQQLRDSGWRSLPGGRDLCPDCAARVQRAGGREHHEKEG